MRPFPPADPNLCARRGPLHAPALVVLGGLGLFLGQPNTFFHLPALALSFPFSLHLLAHAAPSDKSAFVRCWLLGLCGYASCLYWLIHPIHDVGGLSYFLAEPAVLLAAAYLACYPALAGLGMRRLERLFTPRVASSLIPAVAAPCLAGLAYAGFETLCGLLLTGFPWFPLAGAFAPWPAWIQAAALVGGSGLSACFAAAACLGASACIAPFLRQRLAAAAAGVVLAALPALYGELRLARPQPDSDGPPVTILMVQGNVDQNQKWDPSFQENTVSRYLRLSLLALERLRALRPDMTPDLVLWPETAMPFYFQAAPEHSARLRRFAAEQGVNLAFGALGAGEARGDRRDRPVYNRLYLLSADGRVGGIYDKEHLVPFGEYIPFASFLPFLQNLAQGLDFSPGESVPLLALARTGRPAGDSSPFSEHAPPTAPPENAGEEARPLLGALICYEVIFPSLARKRVQDGAGILVTISNDGWFGESSAPLQHLYLAAMRAVEQARPIARATNTGYTASIDARGRVLQRSARLFTDETMLAELRPSLEITLYHRLYPVPEMLLIAAALFSLRTRRGPGITTLVRGFSPCISLPN